VVVGTSERTGEGRTVFRMSLADVERITGEKLQQNI